MKLFEVYVLTQFVHPDGVTKDGIVEEFVSTTSADMGEIVAALQVLYPTMVGCTIIPEGSYNEIE